MDRAGQRRGSLSTIDPDAAKTDHLGEEFDRELLDVLALRFTGLRRSHRRLLRPLDRGLRRGCLTEEHLPISTSVQNGTTPSAHLNSPSPTYRMSFLSIAR